MQYMKISSWIEHLILPSFSSSRSLYILSLSTCMYTAVIYTGSYSTVNIYDSFWPNQLPFYRVLQGFPFTWTNQPPFFSSQGFAGSSEFPFLVKGFLRPYKFALFWFTGFLQGLGSLSSVIYVLFTRFGQYLHAIYMTLAHKA